MHPGTFAVVSLMVGTVVDNSDCGSSSTNDVNATTPNPDTESEGFTEEDLCRIRVAAAVTLMAGFFQVNIVKRKNGLNTNLMPGTVSMQLYFTS